MLTNITEIRLSVNREFRMATPSERAKFQHSMVRHPGKRTYRPGHQPLSCVESR